MNLRILALPALLLSACTVGDAPDDEDALEGEDESLVDPLAASNKGSPGINGEYCKGSPYNCRFRYDDSRIATPEGAESWQVRPGASVRDGQGNVLLEQTSGSMKFNYGQTRLLAGKAHALGMSTSNGSAGWYPIERVVRETAFRNRMGNVDAKDTGGERMACYEIKSTFDANLFEKKVVKDSKSTNERAGDYLPLTRNNGEASANLVFSVPGFGLGGATSDHYRAGTKFRRIGVPTSTGKPSITIPLYVKNGEGRYLKASGTLRFYYGFIVGNGVKRFGWMAEDALKTASGCP